MSTQTRSISQDLSRIKEDVELIKNILMENYELRDDVKAQLARARKAPRSDYISHDTVRKRVLG